MTSEPQVDLSGSDGTTVSAVLAAYADDGFDSSFSVVPDEGLRCSACGEISRADAVPMSSLRRMEGESDPDDMVAIVAMMGCGSPASVGSVSSFMINRFHSWWRFRCSAFDSINVAAPTEPCGEHPWGFALWTAWQLEP